MVSNIQETKIKTTTVINGVKTKVTRSPEGTLVDTSCQCFGHKGRTHSNQDCPNLKVIPVGTILVHSIGGGHDSFWQVVSFTPKSVTARKLEYKCINQSIKNQTCDIIPIKDKFFPPQQVLKLTILGRKKDGDFIYKFVDKNTVMLKVATDPRDQMKIRIGPIKRFDWWGIWNGKPQNQYSD